MISPKHGLAITNTDYNGLGRQADTPARLRLYARLSATRLYAECHDVTDVSIIDMILYVDFHQASPAKKI